MRAVTTFFTTASLTFLRGLARNNRRDWFEAHRGDYEAAIQGPMRALVEEMDVRLARLAPEIVGDPKRSVFRIYRDIRFSRDKSPYKTHVACWFYHRDASHRVGQESHGGGAGFYFHVQPGSSLTAGGLWMPPRPALDRIREAMAAKPAVFSRIVTAAQVRRRFGELDDEAVLKKVPRGYAEGHPAARWLKYQSFTMGRMLSDREVLGPRLLDAVERDYALLLPLVRWINAVLGLKAAQRR